MDNIETTDRAELVRQAQRGGTNAQAELITAYQRRMAGFVYALTGRSDAVDDLVQTVFIKMLRSLPRLHDPGQFEAWLFRLARNTCIDHLRRQRLRRIFLPFAPEHAEISAPSPAVDRAELEALRHALQQLPVRDRALLTLAEQGASQVEMAEATGTSVSAVKARLHRAREKLRHHFRSKHET